ncbi:MAG: PhoH family protein [Bacteroidales bacterium]|jgi:phosphate starvation-inducible PhoH-like protein|nr:PhoH family protein [Bacteroidales bacterium]MBP5420086.1 PhoH family protein [Bacteroidales bacterium]
MIEKLIYLDAVDMVEFCGVNNTKFDLIQSHFPKLKMVCRGNWIKAIGEASDVADFEEKMALLIQYYNEYNVLTDSAINDVLVGNTALMKSSDNSIILHNIDGHPIRPRSSNQKKLIDAADANDMLFAIGPAGSGKTYLAIALAVRALKNKQVKRIILSRPAVEAGEKLGFLPGDMKDKIDPYLQPLYDALADMIPAVKLKEFLENGTIQIAPLAFMRGRTLNNAFVILDEAQNTTIPQIKMFLTRMGSNAKFVITGDTTQIDLPNVHQSGLIFCMHILKNIKDLAMIQFDSHDIVRHKLVQRIVEAFDKAEKESAKRKQTPKTED